MQDAAASYTLSRPTRPTPVLDPPAFFGGGGGGGGFSGGGGGTLSGGGGGSFLDRRVTIEVAPTLGKRAEPVVAIGRAQEELEASDAAPGFVRFECLCRSA